MQNSTLYSYSTLKEMKHNSLLLKYGLCVVTSFQRVQCGKRGKKKNYSGETWQITTSAK